MHWKSIDVAWWNFLNLIVTLRCVYRSRAFETSVEFFYIRHLWIDNWAFSLLHEDWFKLSFQAFCERMAIAPWLRRVKNTIRDKSWITLEHSIVITIKITPWQNWASHGKIRRVPSLMYHFSSKRDHLATHFTFLAHHKDSSKRTRAENYYKKL